MINLFAEIIKNNDDDEENNDEDELIVYESDYKIKNE